MFGQPMLTEDQIECRAEVAMNGLDRRLLDGRLSQEEYDREVKALDRWASYQFTSNCLRV